MVVRYHDNGWVGFTEVLLVIAVNLNLKMFTYVKVVFVAVFVVVIAVFVDVVCCYCCNPMLRGVRVPLPLTCFPLGTVIEFLSPFQPGCLLFCGRGPVSLQ